MPRSRTHHGRPGWPALSPAWQAEAAVPVDNVRNASGTTITITGAGTTAWNPDLTPPRTVTTPGPTIYTGAADITLVTNTDREATVEEQLVNSRIYLISLPVDTTGLRLGQQVKVTTSPDTALVGEVLVVQSVEHGTRRVSRAFYATTSDATNPTT